MVISVHNLKEYRIPNGLSLSRDNAQFLLTFLSQKAAAKELGVYPNSIKHRVKQNLLPYTLINGKKFIPRWCMGILKSKNKTLLEKEDFLPCVSLGKKDGSHIGYFELESEELTKIMQKEVSGCFLSTSFSISELYDLTPSEIIDDGETIKCFYPTRSILTIYHRKTKCSAMLKVDADKWEEGKYEL